MATTAPGLAPATRRGGPDWWQNFWSRAERKTCRFLPKFNLEEKSWATWSWRKAASGWLPTAIGGFASGTAAGTSTRRYHGLLMASLQPPSDRTLFVVGIDETARYGEASFPLATNRWLSGDVSPKGYLQMESFHLEGTKPVWRYAFADALLEKRVWMKQGKNTTFVEYALARGNSPVAIEGKILVSYRDFHATTHGDGWQMKIEPVENGIRVVAFDGATPFFLKSASAAFEPRHEWYRDFSLPAERERGLDDHEDRLLAAVFHARLAVGEKLTLVFSTEPQALLDREQARELQANHDLKLFQAWQKRHSETVATPADDETRLAVAACPGGRPVYCQARAAR